MARFKLPLVVILLLAISTTSGNFSCPKHLPCYCYTSAKNEYKIHCLTNQTTNSAFDITVQPGSKVRIQCKNSPDWSQFLQGTAIVVGPISKFEFASCAPPGPIYSSKIVEWQINARGVEYLKYENLSAPLSAQDLDVFPDLKHLVLSYNRLGEVQRDLLRGLSHLKQLELRNTSIRIPQGFFDKSSSLKTLELSGNNLSTFLTPGHYDPLNLGQSDSYELKPGVFRNLQSLVTLYIQQNNLQILPVNAFADLKNLEIINLGGNNFTSLPAGLFLYNPKLKIINLSNNTGNLTTLPGRWLSGLADLKVVSLARSGILYLPEDLFWGSASMIELNLNENYLSTLPVNLLKDAVELHTLSLFFNGLKHLESGTFANNKKLVKLDLSKNHLTSIREDTFDGLESLQELNMEYNDLNYIDVDAFASLEQLKIANFANNKLTLRTDVFDLFGQISPFHACISLEELILAHNNISEMFSDWMISAANLLKLDLSYNNFENLQAEDFQFMSNNIKIDLSHNQIQQINLARLEYISINQKTIPSKVRPPRNASVLLTSNPIQCDCEIYDFVRYLNNQMDPQAQAFVKLEVENTTCNGPEYISDFLVAQLNSSTIKCLVQSFENQKDDPCASDSACSCWMRPSDNCLFLDCAGKNLTAPPVWIDTRGFDRVELDLSMNELRTGPNMSAKGYNKVNSLNLADNKISVVEESLITPNLKILNLHGNNLSSISSKTLKRLFNMFNISQLTLRNNPWNCNCSSRDLLYYIRSSDTQIVDAMNVTCRNFNVSLSNLSIEQLCPTSNRLIIGFISLASVFVLVLVCAAALCFQDKMKVWLYSKNMCLCLVTEREIDEDKIYDAFISYSHKDEEFVMKELVSKLQNGPKPYKLCIHIRDWFAGDWTSVQIARSIEASRRTIIVLSPNFIESVWNRVEFQAAHKQVLGKKFARVIVIVYGEFESTDNLDSELGAYLQKNTCVKWGDPWFWQKLMYALPHSVELPRKVDQENNCVNIISEKQINQLQVTFVDDIGKTQTVIETVDEVSQSFSDQ